MKLPQCVGKIIHLSVEQSAKQCQAIRDNTYLVLNTQADENLQNKKAWSQMSSILTAVPTEHLEKLVY